MSDECAPVFFSMARVAAQTFLFIVRRWWLRPCWYTSRSVEGKPQLPSLLNDGLKVFN
jgi:hypothetical protein